MTPNVLNAWIIGIAVICGLTLTMWAVNEGKGATYGILSALLILGAIAYVGERQESAFQENQRQIIRYELEDRFYVSGIYLTLIEKQTRQAGNRYRIETQDGEYEVTFQPNETKGFALAKSRGESLRGRRNAHDALKSMPEVHQPEHDDLAYQHDKLYTLEETDGTWAVHLDDDVVTHIADAEGVIRYQAMPNEREEGEEDHE